ncbi:MAG: hypothetical protein ACXWWC_14930 [Chitinophagaceae bacterium]
MKRIICTFIIFILIISCSNKKEDGVINDLLVGKWKFTESFMSPGGPGSWNKVTVADQYIINFNRNGKLDYSPDFFGASSGFNKYKLSGDTIFVSSTLNNKTDEWLYSFEGPQLVINFNVRVICIEGCASRFIKVK